MAWSLPMCAGNQTPQSTCQGCEPASLPKRCIKIADLKHCRITWHFSNTVRFQSRHQMWGRTFWLKVPQGQPSQLNKCKGSKIVVYMWSLPWNVFRNSPCFATGRPVFQSVQFAPGPMDMFRTYCNAAIWCKITKTKKWTGIAFGTWFVWALETFWQASIVTSGPKTTSLYSPENRSTLPALHISDDCTLQVQTQLQTTVRPLHGENVKNKRGLGHGRSWLPHLLKMQQEFKKQPQIWQVAR